MKYPTFYGTIQIDGLSIFYREAGRRAKRGSNIREDDGSP
jgi:hypothetical protein